MTDAVTIDQQTLDGTDYARIKFTGLRCGIPGGLHLGDEIKFTFTARVVQVGEELDDDGVVTPIATVKVVGSVVPS